MPHNHRFRFAVQLSNGPEGTAKSWVDQARRAEDLGFDAVLMPDHFGEQLAPVPALAAVAAGTDLLKIGALVFDNDYRHPLILAKEAATLDLLSEGRLELGLGAGWMTSDYEESGIPYDPPAERIERFAEGVMVIKGLLESEEPFTFSGTHYRITGHKGTPRPVQRPRPPLIIGGGGKRILSLAAREAEIVSVNLNLRGGVAGAEVAAQDGTVEATKRKVGWVKDAAGSRFDDLELNTLIGFVAVTDNPETVLEPMAQMFGVEVSEVRHTPLALIGTIDSMVEELEWRREEYGISYLAVQGDNWQTVAPVVERLAGK
jgi:probable F420-dependent oxidoreductase